MFTRKMLALLAVFLLLMAACAPIPELRDSTLLQDESLLNPPAEAPAQPTDADAQATPSGDDAVRDSVTIAGSEAGCTAPCWRGITPGVTTWRDALTLLEDDPTLQDVQVQTEENNPSVGALFTNVGGSRACCAVASRAGEIVDQVTLQLAPTMTLGEVIAVWGDPTYTIAGPFSEGQAILYAFYPDVPMLVVVFVAGETGSVSETSEIIGVSYITPETMDELISSTPLHFWEGYDAYTAYDDEAGTFDITAVPTVAPEATPGS